jgi:outer membrane protein
MFIVKKIISIFLVLLCSTPLYADKALKVGVVDIQAAIDASHHVAKISKKLEQEFGPSQTDLKSLNNDIVAMEERFIKDAAIMGESEVRRLQQELNEKKSRLKFEGYELQRKVQARQQELSAPLMKMVEEVMTEFKNEGKYDLILHKQTTLHFREEYDLTKQLTEKLNKKK